MSFRIVRVLIGSLAGCADPSWLAPPDVEGWIPEAVEGSVVHDLGVFVTDRDGQTAPMDFHVTDETGSFMVVTLGHPDTISVVGELIDPAGTPQISLDEPEGVTRDASDYLFGLPGLKASPNGFSASGPHQAVVVPNTPRIALTPGPWTFRSGAFEVRTGLAGQFIAHPLEAAVHVFIVERLGPPLPEGRVNLALYFTGANGFTAQKREDPAFQATLQHVRDRFATVGIAIGEVEYVDVDAESVITSRDPGCRGGGYDADALFADLPPREPGFVPVVFVNFFECVRHGKDQMEGVVGISTGLPGVPNARNGVLLSTHLELRDDVFAHELGHFLGLQHVVEPAGPPDNLDDTPVARAEAITNLMFPTADNPEVGTLTADQGWVLRQHPSVH
jgi:hypothetical protein